MLRFIPQATLDAWMDQGKVDVQPDRLVDLATRQEYLMREGVHFVRLESGPDTQDWLDRVKTVEEVRTLGAEPYMSSVIAGETVYQVDPGWVVQDADGGPAPHNNKKGDGKNPEADALAQLLLDKLS